MDRLDKISLLFIAVLIFSVAVLAVTQAKDSPEQTPREATREAVKPYNNPELDKKLAAAQELIAADSLAKAEELIKNLLAEFPYEGMPYMLLADLHMRRQAPLDAMLEYRKGVELNPDFLDKKTKSFQGKKIKVNLQEARAAINLLENQPDKAADLKQYKKTLYYLQRRLAGSCG